MSGSRDFSPNTRAAIVAATGDRKPFPLQVWWPWGSSKASLADRLPVDFIMSSGNRGVCFS